MHRERASDEALGTLEALATTGRHATEAKREIETSRRHIERLTKAAAALVRRHGCNITIEKRFGSVCAARASACEECRALVDAIADTKERVNVGQEGNAQWTREPKKEEKS